MESATMTNATKENKGGVTSSKRWSVGGLSDLSSSRMGQQHGDWQ